MRLILTFPSLQQVLKAEKLLRTAESQFSCRTTPTPPGLSADICGMSLELLEPGLKDEIVDFLGRKDLIPMGVHSLESKEVRVPTRTTAVLMDSFAPLTEEHLYRIDFALNLADSVLVLLLEDMWQVGMKPIPVSLRLNWLKESRPDIEVKICADKESALAYLQQLSTAQGQSTGRKFDFFLSADKGDNALADILSARFVPTDPGGELFQRDSSARFDPIKNFDKLAPAARLTYLKRVCIFGPESTGKSTLTKNLARHFQTRFVPEYARTFMEAKNNQLEQQDLAIFAAGMAASENALAHTANRVLFSDTDALTTCIWSEWLYKEVPEELLALAQRQRHDLYLLLDVDVPWIEDPQRYYPEERETFLASCKQYLERWQRPYQVISGSFEERLEKSIMLVSDLLNRVPEP